MIREKIIVYQDLSRQTQTQTGYITRFKSECYHSVDMLMLLVAGLISGVCLEFRYPLQLDDGVRLQGYMWKPRQENSIRALVFISHGYAELLTPYYREVAEAGAEAGLLMFGHDHLGHGRSDGKRGQAKDMSDYVEPLLGHCRYVQDQYPGLPLFIIGHSMGGLVTVLSILQTQVRGQKD